MPRLAARALVPARKVQAVRPLARGLNVAVLAPGVLPGSGLPRMTRTARLLKKMTETVEN